jgi:hypothetical protein
MSNTSLYLCAILHGIGLVVTIVNMVYQILFVRNTKAARKKVGVTDKLVIGWSTVVFGSSTTYYLNAFSGFERHAATVDGQLGSAPTALCSVQSFLVTMVTNMVSGYAFIMALNVYLPIVRGWKPRDIEAVEKWFHLYPFLTALVFSIIAAVTTTAGPLAFWCWITCEETGIPIENLNPGKCWIRILVLYGPLILNCVACLGMLIPLVKLLLTHIRKATASNSNSGGGGEGAKKGFRKTVIFLVIYSGIVIAASAGRVKGALQVDPTSEGKIGLTEFSAALIPIAVVGIFASTKWFNPFSKQNIVLGGDTGASQRSTKGATDAASTGSEREMAKKDPKFKGNAATTKPEKQ